MKNLTFVAAAEMLIADGEARVRRGENSPYLVVNYRLRLASCRAFFGATAVAKVDRRRLKDLRNWLADRGLKPSSINPVMSFVSMVLKLAEDDGFIADVPDIPRAKVVDNPRPAFPRSDYVALLAGLRRIELGNPSIIIRGHPVDWELRALVTFMVNSFVRPADLFVLRHRQIEKRKTEQGLAYLRLDYPSSKGHSAPVVTMPAAATIYRNLVRRRGAVAAGDYVFLPDQANRTTAKEIVRQQFNAVLFELDLKETARGEKRSLYSLRHSAITFRLLDSDRLDLLTLARNCRTSVEMIDRFYAKSLTAEMNKDLLHSYRRQVDERMLG